VNDSARRFEAWWILGVLGILIALFGVLTPSAFLSLYNAQNVVADASSLLVLAVGMTFVIATRGIDLSVGAVLVFAEVAAVKAMIALGGDGTAATVAGVLISLGVGGLWGALNGVAVAYWRIPPMIATLGTLGMAGGGGLLITNGANVRSGVPQLLIDGLGSGTVLGVLPAVAVVALAVALAAGWVLNATRFGLHVLATGSNEQALSRAGIDVRPIQLRVYVVSGMCAGLAAVIDLARFSTTTIGGHTTDNLDAVTAVVIGGTSLFGGVATIAGTVIGVFIPAVLADGLVIANVPSFWQQVVVGAVLIAAVYADGRRRGRI